MYSNNGHNLLFVVGEWDMTRSPRWLSRSISQYIVLLWTNPLGSQTIGKCSRDLTVNMTVNGFQKFKNSNFRKHDRGIRFTSEIDFSVHSDDIYSQTILVPKRLGAVSDILNVTNLTFDIDFSVHSRYMDKSSWCLANREKVQSDVPLKCVCINPRPFLFQFPRKSCFWWPRQDGDEYFEFDEFKRSGMMSRMFGTWSICIVL